MRRLPISVASQRGVSRLAADAGESRLALTSHGRVVAIVDDPGRLDEDLRRVREAAVAVLDVAAARLSERSTHVGIEEACARLGVPYERVVERAAQLQEAGRAAG